MKVKSDFKKKKYTLIKNVLDKKMCGFIYNYCKLRYMNLIDFKKEPWYRSKIDGIAGWIEDEQVKLAASWYSDPLFESLLIELMPLVAKISQRKLGPNYSYWRMYLENATMKKHIDRPACELSTTICIGYDIDNLKDKSYKWPLYIKGKKQKKGTPVFMEPGDMIVYEGCELEHWRNKFIGNNHCQVFLHYNDLKKGKGKLFDDRPRLGLPDNYKYNAV